MAVEIDVFRIAGIPLLLYTLYGFHQMVKSHFRKFVDYQVRYLIQPGMQLPRSWCDHPATATNFVNPSSDSDPHLCGAGICDHHLPRVLPAFRSS